MEWRLIFDPPAEGAWNMAVDEALLESAGRAGQGGCLRFYLWNVPTLSLGYFQRHTDRASHPPSRDCPLVRRSTGGGAIIHDQELTYSLTTPVSSHVDADLRRFYDALHETLVEELATWRVPAQRYPGLAARASAEEPFLCFQRRSEGDVLVGDAKIAGSAQRRHRRALLQHGSVLLRSSPASPELDGIAELRSAVIEPWALAERWANRIVARLGGRSKPGALTDEEYGAAERFRRDRFIAGVWTCRR